MFGNPRTPHIHSVPNTGDVPVVQWEGARGGSGSKRREWEGEEILWSRSKGVIIYLSSCYSHGDDADSEMSDDVPEDIPHKGLEQWDEKKKAAAIDDVTVDDETGESYVLRFPFFFVFIRCLEHV